MDPAERLKIEIRRELGITRTKFRGENATTLAVIEEVGELATAAFSESRARVRKKAAQVACMEIRVVPDPTLYQWRVDRGLDALGEPEIVPVVVRAALYDLAIAAGFDMRAHPQQSLVPMIGDEDFE